MSTSCYTSCVIFCRCALATISKERECNKTPGAMFNTQFSERVGEPDGWGQPTPFEQQTAHTKVKQDCFINEVSQSSHNLFDNTSRKEPSWCASFVCPSTTHSYYGLGIWFWTNNSDTHLTLTPCGMAKPLQVALESPQVMYQIFRSRFALSPCRLQPLLLEKSAAAMCQAHSRVSSSCASVVVEIRIARSSLASWTVPWELQLPLKYKPPKSGDTNDVCTCTLAGMRLDKLPASIRFLSLSCNMLHDPRPI
jgi:hypothetical protein